MCLPLALLGIANGHGYGGRYGGWGGGGWGRGGGVDGEAVDGEAVDMVEVMVDTVEVK